MVSFARFLTRLKWRLLPGSSRREKAEAEQFGELLQEILPLPQRTEAEQAAFEAELEQGYLNGLNIVLRKERAVRTTDDAKWRRTLLSLRLLPVQFRVKFIETAVVTSWQMELEQGIYDSHFVFPDYGSIGYDEIEWLELNASQLTEKELEHFCQSLHEIKIGRCHELPLSMKIWRLFGYFELPDENDVIDVFP